MPPRGGRRSSGGHGAPAGVPQPVPALSKGPVPEPVEGGAACGVSRADTGIARLGSARLGSARLGSARLGSARLGSARLGLII